jgi:hypothetical protein
MADVVNLRTARKRAMRREDGQQAQTNRLRHGRSRTERKLAKAEQAKANRDLDHHRIDLGDGQ